MGVLKWLLPVGAIGFLGGFVVSSQIGRQVTGHEPAETSHVGGGRSVEPIPDPAPYSADSNESYADLPDSDDAQYQPGRHELPSWLFTPDEDTPPRPYTPADRTDDGFADAQAPARIDRAPAPGTARLADDAAARAAAAARDVEAAEEGY